MQRVASAVLLEKIVNRDVVVEFQQGVFDFRRRVHEQTRGILSHNLAKQSLAGDAQRVNVLSREIGEKISESEKLAERENGVAAIPRKQDFRQQSFDKNFETGARIQAPNNEKPKENLAYVR